MTTHPLLLSILMSTLLLAGCGGGNSNEGSFLDTGNNTDKGKDKDNGKRINEELEFLYKLIPETFGVGDTLYLNNIYKNSSGLPLAYKVVSMPGSIGNCTITGDDKNILQTIKEGVCYFEIKQAGNAKYLPYVVGKEISIPRKCPANQRPRAKDSFYLYKGYNCVPNYLSIEEPKNIPEGTVGVLFNLTIFGEKLYSQGQDIQVTLDNCTDIDFETIEGNDERSYLHCLPTTAGTYNLIITNNGKTLLDTPVQFNMPKTIAPMPVTKTGVTKCVNGTDAINIDCDDTASLGEYKDIGQDGETQSGIDHQYKVISAGGDSCIKDEATGRTWGMKTDDNGLRDKDWRYFWYNTDTVINRGDVGNQGTAEDNELCGNTLVDEFCNTQAYTEALNKANYCGHNDWRLPNTQELLSLVDYGKIGNPPMINSIFANTLYTVNGKNFDNRYYTQNLTALGDVAVINFANGNTDSTSRNPSYEESNYIRAVRTD